MKVTGRSAKATLSTDSCRAQSRTCASWPMAQGGSAITRALPPFACSDTQRPNFSRVRAEVSYHCSTGRRVTPGSGPASAARRFSRLRSPTATSAGSRERTASSTNGVATFVNSRSEP